jgi:hypothetical protein
MKFKSWIRTTIIWLLLVHAAAAFFAVIFGLCLTDLTGIKPNLEFHLNLNIILIISFLYISIMYIMIATANHDVVVELGRVRVINRVWGFRDSEIFGFSDIDKVVFTRLPDEKWSWALLRRWLVGEYKWIEIYALGKKHRFFCCGIEYDKDDQADKLEPAFEDLFRILRLRGVRTEWI